MGQNDVTHNKNVLIVKNPFPRKVHFIVPLYECTARYYLVNILLTIVKIIECTLIYFYY